MTAIGYKEGKNLFAAPYDWRLYSPELEARDGYFTKFSYTQHHFLLTHMRWLFFFLNLYVFFSRFWSPVALVEEAARDAPVVLLAHSMGNRVVQLLLAHAEATRGRPWIDKQ